jgi:Flp pilus assembly pilin Flp
MGDQRHGTFVPLGATIGPFQFCTFELSFVREMGCDYNRLLSKASSSPESTNVPLLFVILLGGIFGRNQPNSRTWTLPVDSLVALWRKDEAEDIAEYAVMLAVILVIIIGTIRLIGSNSNNVFSSVSSSLR